MASNFLDIGSDIPVVGVIGKAVKWFSSLLGMVWEEESPELKLLQNHTKMLTENANLTRETQALIKANHEVVMQELAQISSKLENVRSSIHSLALKFEDLLAQLTFKHLVQHRLAALFLRQNLLLEAHTNHNLHQFRYHCVENDPIVLINEIKAQLTSGFLSKLGESFRHRANEFDELVQMIRSNIVMAAFSSGVCVAINHPNNASIEANARQTAKITQQALETLKTEVQGFVNNIAIVFLRNEVDDAIRSEVKRINAAKGVGFPHKDGFVPALETIIKKYTHGRTRYRFVIVNDGREFYNHHSVHNKIASRIAIDIGNYSLIVMQDRGGRCTNLPQNLTSSVDCGKSLYDSMDSVANDAKKHCGDYNIIVSNDIIHYPAEQRPVLRNYVSVCSRYFLSIVVI